MQLWEHGETRRGGYLAGAVYVYQFHQSNLVFLQKFVGGEGDHLGYSVALSDGALLVGAPYAFRTAYRDLYNLNALRTGAVVAYRFVDYNHFQYEQHVICDICEEDDLFGRAVSTSHDSAVIGGMGIAFAYGYSNDFASGNRWSYSANLVPPDETYEDADSSRSLGLAVAVWDNLYLVGVRDVLTSSASDVYVREGGIAVLYEHTHIMSFGNSQDTAFYFGVYVILYCLIVLGLLIIAITPLWLCYNSFVFGAEASTPSKIELKPLVKTHA